jgi:hypothetical protein
LESTSEFLRKSEFRNSVFSSKGMMPELSPKQVNTTSKSVERPKGFNIRDSINKLQQKLDLSLTATSNLLVPRPRKND